MHEHIDEMGIINMNGRIYDPLIGRFMSADPYIQAPDDLQSHNRYAYVMNNPLNLTDPSGFSWLSKTWKKVWHNPIFKAVVGIAVAFYAPQMLTTIFPSLFGAGSLATAVASGALSGFASTGTLKGALTGAFTAGIMFGAGEIAKGLSLADGSIGKIALHAGAGCVTSVAGGGSCKSGAMSGALGEFGQNIGTGNSAALGAVKSAMLGGIGSKLSGGKFSDGATTGAFGYMFNYLAHVHASITFEAGIKAGLGWNGSQDLAMGVVGVDFQGKQAGFNWESQDMDHSHMHSMCSAGSSSVGTCALKIADYKEEMWNKKSMDGLAGLLHVQQDSHSPSHADMARYDGTVSIGHAIQDISPMPFKRSQIVRESTQLIKDYLIYSNKK